MATPNVWAGPPYNPDVMQPGPQVFAAAPDDAPAPAEIGKLAMPSATPSVFTQAPAGPDVTRIPTPIEGQIAQTNDALKKLQWKDANPYGTPNNHPGVGGKILHALSVAGNIAGDIFAPAEMALNSNTNLGRNVQESSLGNRLQALAQEQSENEARDAGTARTAEETKEAPVEAADKHGSSSALTRKANDEADALENPTPQYEVHDTPDGPLFVNKLTGAAQHLSVDGHPVGPKIQTKTVQLEIGGKPHQVLVNDSDGTPIKDLGESGEKPPVTNINAGANREFQETERGRGLLDKAEGTYRTAQQGVNSLRDMIGQADAGNKMSAQMLPLEGALEITTAQGVHRINRTEVDQVAGAGNLFDKIAGEMGKLSAGQSIPSNIRADMRKLADAQERAAYATYKGAYDSATKRYSLKNEDALPDPGAGNGHRISMGGKMYQYNGSGATDDMKNYAEVKQ